MVAKPNKNKTLISGPSENLIHAGPGSELMVVDDRIRLGTIVVGCWLLVVGAGPIRVIDSTQTARAAYSEKVGVAYIYLVIGCTAHLFLDATAAGACRKGVPKGEPNHQNFPLTRLVPASSPDLELLSLHCIRSTE